MSPFYSFQTQKTRFLISFTNSNKQTTEQQIVIIAPLFSFLESQIEKISFILSKKNSPVTVRSRKSSTGFE